MSIDDNIEDLKEELLAGFTSKKPDGLGVSVGRWVHYYGVVDDYALLESNEKRRAELAREMHRDVGPFAALVVDVGPGPTTVTLKITDRQGRDHVRANVEYGDPGWMWPPRVGA